jgi:hypothetical protein
MTKKWCYCAIVALAVVAGFLCADNVQAKYAESKSLTLTIGIEKHYTVAFDANGGTGSMANQQFTSGVAQALTANTFANGDYYFAGWNTEADGTGTAYTDAAMISADLTNIGGSTVTLYAQWEEDAMHTVFKIDGTCVFHGYDIQQNTGDGHITGTDCTAGGTDWADGTHKYIDTGIKLYDSTNYGKDYEVGFTITAYDYSHQYQEQGDSASQAAFFNSKLENEARHWPGLVVRRSSDKIEVTETITKPNGSSEKKTANGASATPVKVVITRVNGIVYYSFNGKAFTVLQDLNGTSDYFDVNAWFGAAAKDDGTPMRYIDATMTDIYIKVGDTGANEHTVSFDAGGVVANPANVSIISTGKLGDLLPSMPSYVDTADGRLYFIGWYSSEDGAGEKYDEESIISRDVTLHAFWNDEQLICSVGGITHGGLQECIAEAGAGETITLLEDIREQITIAAGKEIVFDLNGHTWNHNNVAGQPLIENGGKVTIINGTMTSSLRAGVLNNNSTGEMHIGNDARIIATGSRQAIYNNGGKLEISGNAYLSATTSERATVQNLANGQLVITGGTIISDSAEAVKIESGTLAIGTSGSPISREAPIIQGATYGVNTSVNITMYDGELRGKTAAINDANRITLTETGVLPVEETATIDGVVYQILYYR